LLWVYLIAPYLQDQTMPLLRRVSSMAYPVMDIVVLAVVARVAAGSHRRAAPLDAPALRAGAQRGGAPDQGAPGAAGVREPDGAARDRRARSAARAARHLRARGRHGADVRARADAHGDD